MTEEQIEAFTVIEDSFPDTKLARKYAKIMSEMGNRLVESAMYVNPVVHLACCTQG